MSRPRSAHAFYSAIICLLIFGCQPEVSQRKEQGGEEGPAETVSIDEAVGTSGDSSTVCAEDILGNPEYPAICYGGYREATRDKVPTVAQVKDDLKILYAAGFRIVRTYNAQQFDFATNLLKAIRELRSEQPKFEMYVMLGAWIDCEGAWTANPNHEGENLEGNTAEIEAAVRLAKEHPEIVKIVAVGNESMVHWATGYFVQPQVIRKWVEHLQSLKKAGDLPAELWVTTSDNFASWGGGDASYHNDELKKLLMAVDYVSLHTYPFHDTHYNPTAFWIDGKTAANKDAESSSKAEADAAMRRAVDYAKQQYAATKEHIESLGISKPIHIGETGWASEASVMYGSTGSQAADEYKAAKFYQGIREWTNREGISCFYFEAFDEKWKDQGNAGGSENHFGLFTLKGEAKYPFWNAVNDGEFDGLARDGNPVRKSWGGDEDALQKSVLRLPGNDAADAMLLPRFNAQRNLGEKVTESIYLVTPQKVLGDSSQASFPSRPLKLNVWEGTCEMLRRGDDVVRIISGTGDWWGCGLEIQSANKGENLSAFAGGALKFEIRGDVDFKFSLGFQTGRFNAGTQTNNEVEFGESAKFQLTKEWKAYSIPMKELVQNADLSDVTGVFFLRGSKAADRRWLEVRNVRFSQ